MRQQLRHLCCFGYYYSINDIHSPIVNDQTNDTDEISAEYVILEHEGKRAGLEADDQKVHEIVVLDAFVLPQKEDDCDVETRKGQHLEVHPFPEHAEQHQEKHHQMAGVLDPRAEMQVVVAERIDQQHPLLQKLRHRLRVPPVEVEVPGPQLRDLGHGQHDVLHD